MHNIDENKNIGDITKVDETKIDDFNMIVGGSPCFIAGSKVYTEHGYKNIENIIVGDKVLTLKNRFKPVLRTGGKEKQDIYELEAQGILPIRATSNHPFYIRTMKRVWNNKKRSYDRKFSDVRKVELKDLTTSDYVGINILNTSENIYDLDNYDCWLLGRYVADGYDEEPKIISKKFIDLYPECGRGAINKRIPSFIMDLPVNLLKSFLIGCMSREGCYSKDNHKITTISKELAMALSLVVQKVYKVGCRIRYSQRKGRAAIEGRIVDQRHIYELLFTTNIGKQKNYEVIDDAIWYPIRKITKMNFKADVFNLEVDDDHTYTVNNAIVSNCQDFSVAGNKNGSVWKCDDCGEKYNPLQVHWSKRDCCPNCNSINLNKSRSSLLVEWLRIVRAKKPNFGIYENVKNIIGKEFKETTFKLFLEELQEYGYNTLWDVLNSKDYGVPQNRERLYLIIIKKELDNERFQFPKPFDNGIRLKDILEDTVDEKYYISQDKVNKLLSDIKDKTALLLDLSNAGRDGGRRGPHIFKDYSPCVTARIYKDPYLIKENRIKAVGRMLPDSGNQNQDMHHTGGISETVKATTYKNSLKVLQVGNIVNTGNFKNPQRGRIYSARGLSPALNTCGGGGQEPKIVVGVDKGHNEPKCLEYSNCITAREDRGISNRKSEGTAVVECIKNNIVMPTLTPDRINKRQNGRRFKMNGEPSFTITAQDRHGVLLVDDTQGFDGVRVYRNASPTIRSQRNGLKIMTAEEYTGNIEKNISIKKAPSIIKSKLSLKTVIYYYVRIRKLTPLECFRLMGFSDEYFETAKYYTEKEASKLKLRSKKKYRDLPLSEKIERVSNSQLYKQAGNSIVVDVLYYILLELYKVMPYLFDNIKLGSFFTGIGAFECALNRLQETVNW